MLSRLAKSRVDLDELEEQLKHKHRVEAIRKQYEGDEKETFEEKAKGVLGSVIRVGKHAVRELSKDHLSDTQTAIEETSEQHPKLNQSPVTDSSDTQAIADQEQIDSLSDTSQTTGYESPNNPSDKMQFPVRHQINTVSDIALEHEENVQQIGLSVGRNMPLEEAAAMLQYDVTTVKRMVSQGKLKAPNGSNQLVTKASVNVLLEKRQGSPKRGLNHRTTDDQASLKQSGNDVSDNCQTIGQDQLCEVSDTSQSITQETGQNGVTPKLDTLEEVGKASLTNGHTEQQTDPLALPVMSANH